MDLLPHIPKGPSGTVTGILLILIGILALVLPVLAFDILVLFFAAFVIIYSLGLIRSCLHNEQESRFTSALQLGIGILGILFGIVILAAPFVLSIAVKVIFAAWAILTGAGTLLNVNAGGVRMDRNLTLLSGLILFIIGLLLLIVPSILTDYILIIILGLFAVFSGILMIWSERDRAAEKRPVNRLIYK